MQGDQTLAGHVLRFANSVLYGGHIPAETLQEAIARVGFNVIGELATVLTFGNNIFRSKGLQSLMDDIQEHAVLTAFLARDLGKATSGPSDQLFLCGLLHTVGKPILLQLVTTMGVMIPMRPPMTSSGTSWSGCTTGLDPLPAIAGTCPPPSRPLAPTTTILIRRESRPI